MLSHATRLETHILLYIIAPRQSAGSQLISYILHEAKNNDNNSNQ